MLLSTVSRPLDVPLTYACNVSFMMAPTGSKRLHDCLQLSEKIAHSTICFHLSELFAFFAFNLETNSKNLKGPWI